MPDESLVAMTPGGRPIMAADFGRHDEPSVVGYVKVRARDEGLELWAWVRPATNDDDLSQFAEWLDSRLDRFLEHGPEPDGWQSTSDGRWQMWARKTTLPDLDIPNDTLTPNPCSQES